jgi:hypothetical protein
MEKKQVATMRDSNGNDIPLKYVSKYDKAKDKAVRKILARFVKARHALESVVAETVAELNELAATKESVGAKGNFSARSFDALVQVEIRQQYNIQLDERVARARELMLDYVRSEIESLNKDTTFLRKLVEDSFRANEKGYLPISSILKLMRYEVKDARWNEARGILQDAITPVAGKRYLVCSVRDNTQQDFKAIRLDLADCWP